MLEVYMKTMPLKVVFFKGGTEVTVIPVYLTG